jgi:AAA family ATP:ADP antiporter
MLTQLAARLQLKTDEMKRALALGLILGGVTASYTLTKTVRDAEFLAALPATLLPYVYLGVGIVSGLASIMFVRATRRAATWESLAVMALIAALSLAAFAQLFRITATWVPVAFYLWSNVYGLILVAQFWLFANGVSNPREARRTFSWIGLGGIVGGLLGGLIAAPLAQLWPLPSLLNAAAVLQALVVLLVRVSSSRAKDEAEAPESEARVDPMEHTYVRWLAIATLCSVMVTGLLDYQFKVEMQRRFSSSSDLASFFGLFYTATNLVAFLLQALATGWMIQRLGASWSASVLPAGLGITTVLTLVVPGFAAVTAGRLWDQVARLSVGKAVGELFYIPLEPGLRRRAKSFIGAGLERLGDGFAGIVILVAGLTIGASTRNLAFMVAALLLVWVLAWWRVRRGYVSELGQNLRRMNLGVQQSRVSLREASILREMERLLESRYERIVLQGIDLLEEDAPEKVEEALDRLLAHPSPRVRARALKFLRDHRVSGFPERVEQMIHDQDPEVQVQALSARSAMAGTDPFEPLREYLGSPDPRVRSAAILALTEQASCDAEGELKQTLDGLLGSGDPRVRSTVAEALGRRPPPCELHGMLTPLLRDPDSSVRRSALRSAGKAGRRQHVPAVIEALGERATEDAARDALASLGDRVVGTLGDYLADATVAIEVRQSIPRALGEIHTQNSVSALFRYRDHDDIKLSYRVLKASNRLRASGMPLIFPRRLVTEDIERDVKAHLFALIHYRSSPSAPERSAERLLWIALKERMEQSLNRGFRRLALIYPPQNILAAYQGVTSNNPRLRGNALEYLENALSPEHKALLFPLVDDASEERRVRLAEQRFGIRFVSYGQTLEDLLRSDDPWLRACALFVAGARKERALLPAVESNLRTSNALVRETASWARLAIESG